jgi:chromosome segregation ATPase
MFNSTFVRSLIAAVLTQSAFAGTPALAQGQSKGGGGKIVCWKDKSGKVIGCGDSVPPEYRTSATTELDKRGVTRKTVESAEDAAKRQAREKEFAAQKAAEERKAADQRRQDSALLATYANEQEIDMKRDRELKIIETQIGQTQGALKSAEARLADAKSRKADADAARASAEVDRLQKTIAAKEKEREELRQTYAAQKKRYQELKGTAQSAAAPAPAAPAPTKK